MITVEVAVRHPDVIGESPAYDAANRRLVWGDLFGEKVHELSWTGAGWRAGRTWQIGQLATAVVPRAGGGVVVVTRSDLVALSDDGEVEVLGSLPGGSRGTRFNDARCDPQGRLIAGWMADDATSPGGVVRMDTDGHVESILDDVGLANGIDWSPDSGTMYFVDSLLLGVDAFDYDKAYGAVSNRRPILRIERGIGGPNGIAVDHEGCLWVAITYAGEVRRYSPAGELLDTIVTPTPRPTGCAFAGPDGTDMFITSSSFSPPESVLRGMDISDERVRAAARDEFGGALFVCQPGVSGPSATPFAG